MSCAASDSILESSEGTEINGSQPETRATETASGILKHGDSANKFDSLRSLSITHPPHMGQRSGAQGTPLTARALRQHNNQQRHISQQQDTAAMKSIGASASEIYVRYGDGIGDRNDYLSEARFHIKRHDRGRKAMSNKAEGGVTDQEATVNLESFLGFEDDAMDQLGGLTDYAHLSYWDTGTAYELTARRDDLAGVGEHLADYTYQGYTSDGFLVVK